MSSKLDTEILINLSGNLVSKARQYGSSMSSFAQNNKRAMSVVQATSAAAGRGLDRLGSRYTGIIAGLAGGAMLREFAQVDRRITRMGIAAEKSRTDMANMFNGIQEASIKFRVDDSELVGAVEKVGTVTGDIDFGFKNKDVMGASIAASGSSGESIGALFAGFTKFQLETQQQTLEAMDTLNLLGKEGAFELKDIAEKGVTAFSMYSAAGGTGVKGIKDVGVMFESAIDATGSRDTAATAVENFIRDIQNPKVMKALKNNGIPVFDKAGKIRPLPTLLEEISKKSGSKGAEQQSGRLTNAGFNQDSVLLISSASSQKGAENLKRYQTVVGDGKSIMQDAAYAAQDFTSAMQSLHTTWGKFTNNQLAKPVQELADALNSVDQETVQNWLEIGKNVTLTIGGLLAARKAYQIGKGAYDFLNPGKKGVPKGVTDAFGSGVMPVYVVNMGTGGLPAAGSPNGPKQPLPGGNPAPPAPTSGGFWGAATRALTGAGMVYAQNELAHWGAKTIYDSSGAGEWAKNSSVRSWADEAAQSSNIKSTQVDPSSVWAELKEWINSTPEYKDPSPWASLQSQNQASIYPMVPPQLQGEIRVVVEGDARVKSVSMNQSGVTLSAQSGVRNVGQD
ncbi:phage tail tape measure protein [Yersinia enterocolitica]